MNSFNKRSFILNVVVSVVISVASIVPTFLGVLLTGFVISLILELPIKHEHNFYACSCDANPTLTEMQAIIVAVFVAISMMLILYYISKTLKFCHIERMVMLLLYIAMNIIALHMAIDFLSTQVTG